MSQHERSSNVSAPQQRGLKITLVPGGERQRDIRHEHRCLRPPEPTAGEPPAWTHEGPLQSASQREERRDQQKQRPTRRCSARHHRAAKRAARDATWSQVVGDAVAITVFAALFAPTLAKWFGLSASDRSIVFPNIGRFANPDLGFML